METTLWEAAPHCSHGHPAVGLHENSCILAPENVSPPLHDVLKGK